MRQRLDLDQLSSRVLIQKQYRLLFFVVIIIMLTGGFGPLSHQQHQQQAGGRGGGGMGVVFAGKYLRVGHIALEDEISDFQ